MKSRPIKQPINPGKPVARILICGAIGYTVTDQQPFNKPSPEQIANLKRLLNIDVELFDEEVVEEAIDGASEGEVVS